MRAWTAPRPPSPPTAPKTAQPRTPCTTVRVGTVSPFCQRRRSPGPAPTGSGRRRTRTSRKAIVPEVRCAVPSQDGARMPSLPYIQSAPMSWSTASTPMTAVDHDLHVDDGVEAEGGGAVESSGRAPSRTRPRSSATTAPAANAVSGTAMLFFGAEVFAIGSRTPPRSHRLGNRPLPYSPSSGVRPRARVAVVWCAAGERFDVTIALDRSVNV